MPRIAGPLTISMFLGSFAWSFAFISLPFYIQSISPYDSATTLRWAGWILGISSLVTVLTSPAWGRVGERGNPRTQYLLVQVFQGVAFMGMAIAHTLPQLFVARLILGAMGAASTLAFIMAGRRSDPSEVRREVAAVQLAMTMGQVLGPLGGAATAARVGFRPSFVVGGVILLGSAAFVHWGVRLAAHLERPRVEAAPARMLDLVAPVALVLAVSNQLFFLTAVLPEVLPGLGVAPERVVEVGGLLVFVSAVAAGLGALATPRLAALLPEGTADRRAAGVLRPPDGRDGAPAQRLGLRGRPVPPGALRGADLPARRGPHGPAAERQRDRRHQLGPDRRLVHRARAGHLDSVGVVPGRALRGARAHLPGLRPPGPAARGFRRQ